MYLVIDPLDGHAPCSEASPGRHPEELLHMTLGIARPVLPPATAASAPVRAPDPRVAGEDPARIRATIARAPLFAALPITAIEDLTSRVSVRKVAVGSAVVAQDEPGDAMFVIMSGRVKVVIFGESGREVTLSLLRSGDSFGEMSLFDQAPRSAHCLAIEPTTLLVLSREDLMRHMQAHPRTAMNLLGEMARRLRRADETIAQLALCDVNERLIHRLVGLAREEGASGPDGLVVRRRPTQQELANMIGSCRETISRAFNQLARDGLIIPRGRSLVVTPALIERAEKKKAA
jgi:CRP-like cAMP-binding protein